MPQNIIDLQGQRFGRWTVIERAKRSKAGISYWRCACDCGNEKEVASYSLRTGNSRSCGCINALRLRSRRVTKATKA